MTSNYYQPENDMLTGSYKVWVRAFNSAGEGGAWSTPIGFILVQNDSALQPTDNELLPLDQATDQVALAETFVEPSLQQRPVFTQTEHEPQDTTHTNVQQADIPNEQESSDHRSTRQQQPVQVTADQQVIEAVMLGWPQAEWWLNSGKETSQPTPQQDQDA